MVNLLAKGLLLGIGAAAPIGPVNIEIARRTLQHGFRAGFALGVGAVTVDVTYAILTSLGVASLSRYPLVYGSIPVLGAMLLTYLGVSSIIAAIQASRTNPIVDEAYPSTETTLSTLRRGYFTGLMMTFFNPMTLFFWFTAVPSALGKSDVVRPRTDLPIICTGVFLATLAWVVFFASALKWLRRWRRQWWMTAADATGGLVLLGFAGFAIWTTLARYL
jgi:threonine/homoserine/homoserine lactone efflux protein